MTLRLHNTLTKERETLVPIDPRHVRMYVCGPTVYDFAHIGNARPVIVFDLLYRLLRHRYGARHVVYVRNITDVDDKINARAAAEYPGLPLNDAIRIVTEKTNAQFQADVAALGCLEPTEQPRATEHINAMKALIERLVEKGVAYVAEGHVLFSPAAMDSLPGVPRYGALARRSLDEMIGELGFANSEVRDMIEMHADLPDLWDLAHGAWEDCSGPSRFKEEAAQESLVSGIKKLTSKPVVGVGRFTSPDVMVRMIKSGTLDFIGCARPSIADPFLPKKVEEGRIEDIRECIGCNICVTGDMTMSISRCTQNPTFMEEWRKGWHPERMQAKGDSETVLIVGAGPAGLEAARALGSRGYRIALAEAGTELGGRVARECRLPGLSAWGRVRDYRQYQLSQMENVDIYFDSRLSADDILGFGFENVAIATGSTWRRDGVARAHVVPMPIDPAMPVYTPDDLMDGKIPTGNVVLFDDDHYYMGGVLAELMARQGAKVTLVTPSAYVSDWTRNTLEQMAIHRRLVEAGVEIVLNRAVTSVEASGVTTACAYTGLTSELSADAVVLVTSRQQDDSLWQELKARESEWAENGIRSIKVIGDAEAPGPIAWATYAGHRFARELDEPDIGDALPFRREVTALAAD